MRKEVLLMIAAVMTAVFFGCDDQPATKAEMNRRQLPRQR